MHRERPKAQNANAAQARGGAAEKIVLGRTSEEKDSRPAFEPQYRIRDWQDVDALSDQLESICIWKEDIEKRIAIAQFRFELLDVNHDLSELEGEAEEFCRACRTLMWREMA
jgi:hypothetical protein